MAVSRAMVSSSVDRYSGSGADAAAASLMLSAAKSALMSCSTSSWMLPSLRGVFLLLARCFLIGRSSCLLGEGEGGWTRLRSGFDAPSRAERVGVSRVSRAGVSRGDISVFVWASGAGISVSV